MPTNDTLHVRYAEFEDKTNVLCRECSTRTLGVLIPRDEVEDHDNIHDEWDEMEREAEEAVEALNAQRETEHYEYLDSVGIHV